MSDLSFKELTLKTQYDTEEDDVLTTFYIPVLKRAKKYYRLAGFFSSNALMVAAKGISEFINNDGKMRLICGAGMQESDVKAIIEGKEKPEKIISEIMIKTIEDIYDTITKNHIKALAWLVAKNQLDIKIAIVIDSHGNPMTQDDSNKHGIFHQKIGILEDFDGNQISFSGSINETAFAWNQNVEEFKIFRGWIDDEKKYLMKDLEKFEKYWNGNTNRVKIMDIPDAVRERILRLAPKDISELNLTLSKNLELRGYQRTAVNKWIQNKKGIIEMATGTGKTRIALYCLKDLMTKERIVAVISTPYVHLNKQWEKKEIATSGITSKVITADSSDSNWKNQLVDNLIDFRNGIIDSLIVLTTHATFSSDEFMKIIKQQKARGTFKLFLIIDEVHGIGAPERKKGLINEYDYRLGLSATPKRWFDLQGTDAIFSYFGDVVYQFTLKDAIDAGYLTPYFYKPHFTTLNNFEMNEYINETRKLAKLYHSSLDQDEKDSLFTLFSIKRQKIVRNASNKLNVFKAILDEIGELKYCLIYCSPSQIREVQKILNERGIVQHKFTEVEGTSPNKEFSGLTEREFLINKFAEGLYQALVSIKCLDEGVDVPPARIAIMLDNSGNPREYIQRRGRILRTYPGKKYATIFDIIVEPILQQGIDKEVGDLEKNIIKKELNRCKEFASTAINKEESFKILEEIEIKYDLDGD